MYYSQGLYAVFGLMIGLLVGTRLWRDWRGKVCEGVLAVCAAAVLGFVCGRIWAGEWWYAAFFGYLALVTSGQWLMEHWEEFIAWRVQRDLERRRGV